MNEIIDSVRVGEQETAGDARYIARVLSALLWSLATLQAKNTKRKNERKKILVTEHTHTDTHSRDSACSGVLSVPHATHWPGTFLPHTLPTYLPSFYSPSSSYWLPAALLLRCCHIILSEMLSKCALPAASPQGGGRREQGQPGRQAGTENRRRMRSTTKEAKWRRRRSSSTSRKSWKWK